jgi:hypothetical protein
MKYAHYCKKKRKVMKGIKMFFIKIRNFLSFDNHPDRSVPKPEKFISKMIKFFKYGVKSADAMVRIDQEKANVNHSK